MDVLGRAGVDPAHGRDAGGQLADTVDEEVEATGAHGDLDAVPDTCRHAPQLINGIVGANPVLHTQPPLVIVEEDARVAQGIFSDTDQVPPPTHCAERLHFEGEEELGERRDRVEYRSRNGSHPRVSSGRGGIEPAQEWERASTVAVVPFTVGVQQKAIFVATTIVWLVAVPIGVSASGG